MAGTSPSAFHQSASFQSSSYLPKMEALYFKENWCCNTNYSSLHDLMQHMEESHGQASADILNRPSLPSQAGFSFPKQPSTPSNLSTKPVSQAAQSSASQVTRGFQTASSQAKSTLATIQDDPLDSMDFDELQSIMPQVPLPSAPMSQQPFRGPIAIPNSTQPFSLLSSNPTVSSVNTPTLSTQPVMQNKTTPDSSIPTTPHAVNMTSFDASLDLYGLTDPNGMPLMTDGTDFNIDMGLQNELDLDGLTITDPAKQLSSRNGTLNAGQLRLAFNNNPLTLNNDLAQGIHHQPLAIGLPGAMLGFPGHEEKKFKCPVIGCEKAYKNQNGLKYHKTHGHQNQKLKLNTDGSYSIVDPVTSVPYPGTVGMEKEKPYRCDKCGKRYKNLNGLKYHRQHSAPCNPEMQTHVMNGVPGVITLQQLQNMPNNGIL